MKRNDSFKQPGSVPFKWEIRPGVPKTPNPHPPLMDDHLEFRKQTPTRNLLPKTRPKLKPPPAGFYFQPPLEPRINSFRSVSSRRLGLPGLAQPDVVSLDGCFPLKQKNVKKRMGEARSRGEPEYYSDLDTPSRWSVSSRKSVSPLSSSFASCQSSPRPAGDADWAGFGLF